MFNFSLRGIDFDLDPDAVSADPPVRCDAMTLRIPLCRTRNDRMHPTARPGSKVRRFQPLAVPDGDGCAVVAPFDAEFEAVDRVRIPRIGRVPCALLRKIATVPDREPETYDIDGLGPEAIVQLAFNASVTDTWDDLYLFEKLTRARESGVQIVVADCADDQPHAALGALMLKHYRKEIEQGLLLMARAVGAPTAAVALCTPEQKFETDSPVTPLYVGTKYPAMVAARKAAEKAGGGLIVSPSACVHLYRAAAYRLPQTTQFLSVCKSTGKIRLAEAYIGAELEDTLHACRLIPKGLLIANGVMTGEETSADAVVFSGLHSLCVMKEAKIPAPTPCIGCGACNRVCPERLLPSYILRALEKNDFEEAAKLHMHRCTGCGCCTYVCPAGLPVGRNLKVGYDLYLRQKQAEAAPFSKEKGETT